VNTSDDGNLTRRRRRQHTAEFKAKVVSACHKPGVSIAAVALANRLNANLLRRWVVAEVRAPTGKAIETVSAVPARSSVESRTFIPIQVDSSAVTAAREIRIELRRGATMVKVDWPLAAAADCAAWLRELLR
jgi:transposase-like protein